ncbi:MAG: GDYXXLXY domain-containing protein [Rhizobacter sp.]|nr:GDYXXLXY domain-containing protein [Ferruginibacter sp.]
MKNKNKIIIWLAFALLVLLQLWVPASVIRKKEDILSTGTAFKFRTAPRDPNDYLRGKYVFLNFNETAYTITNGKNFENGQLIYVTVGTDSAGFAKIIAVSDNEKDAPENHIKTLVNYTDYADPKKIFVQWPFERFYMEESKAPLAEEAYNETRVDSSIISYALVKVKYGDAVLENVYIDNKPIDEYIKKK